MESLPTRLRSASAAEGRTSRAPAHPARGACLQRQNSPARRRVALASTRPTQRIRTTLLAWPSRPKTNTGATCDGMRDARAGHAANDSSTTTCSWEALKDDTVSFTPVSAGSRALLSVPQFGGLRRRQRHFQGRRVGGRSRRLRSPWLNPLCSFEAGPPLLSESGGPSPFPRTVVAHSHTLSGVRAALRGRAGVSRQQIVL